MIEFCSIEKNNTQYLSKIENEWQKLINGKNVNSTLLDGAIYKSWLRSKKANIDPYKILNSHLLNRYEAEKKNLKHDELMKAFGGLIDSIQAIANRSNLCLQVFDTCGESVKVFLSNSFLKKSTDTGSPVVANICEHNIGTNAASLCLENNRPVQLVGPEHFNHSFHDLVCSCAPIHDSEGGIVGVINIVNDIRDEKVDALPLSICLANIFGNRELAMNSLKRLNVNEFALRQMVDSFPKGAAYLSGDSMPPVYNQELAELLAIECSEDANQRVNSFASTLSNYEEEGKDLREKQIVHNVAGGKKTFVVSTKKIFDRHQELQGRIVIVENAVPAKKQQRCAFKNKVNYEFDSIVGKHPSLLQAKDVARQVADCHVPVLILGESGTGKEVFAQAIHQASSRSRGPFVAINCGAIPAELIESELFGYVPGAFTGAMKGGKVGKLEHASGGTLFFDEVESMPLDVQVKLLRALSTKTITRVGGLEEIPIDIRTISATKSDLLNEADAGKFREDLYYRINTVSISLPSLRKRREDIPLLVDHFLKLCSDEFNFHGLKIGEDFLDALMHYSWRGNIRELKNVTERAIALRRNACTLTLSLLPEKIINSYKYNVTKAHLKDNMSRIENELKNKPILRATEEITIERILTQEKGNISSAARILGVTKPTLYSKIKQSERLTKVKNRFKD